MPVQHSALIKKTLLRKCALHNIPVNGIFELTPRCNLQCRMCYIRLSPEEMSSVGRERGAEEWLNLAQQAKKAGLVFLLLTGGEPTLRSDFAEIYTALAKMGMVLTINTNATHLVSSIRSAWYKDPPAQVNITLYGTSREEYASLCGDPAAYDHVCEAIDWLQSENILVHLNATITPRNQHQWKAYAEFAKQHGLELRLTNYCFPPRRRTKYTPCQDFERLTPEDAGRMIADDLFHRDGIEKIRQRLSEKENSSIRDCIINDDKLPMQCLAGRAQFWITWDGRMLPCGMFDYPSTLPFDSGFDNAWTQLVSECSSIRLPSECTTCPDRKTCLNCAAVTYSETGRFDGKPEYMCAMNRAYQAALRYYDETYR